MNAFKLLKTDHKKVAQLFEEIESASGAGKAELFSELKSELDLHAHIEEQFLYPALENKEPAREITLEAYEEHKVVKDLLAELATQAINDEWDAKLKVLKENVEHHVEEEEGELFDKAEKVLSEEQIERLGVEMEAEKAAQNGDAPPPASSKGRRTSKKAPAKSRSPKSEEKPGVLQRLANLVGIGTAAVPSSRKVATKKSSKKVASKAATVARKSGTKGATKAPARGTKRTSPRKASKSGAAKRSASKQPASQAARMSAASPRKKASKKSASKKSASKKK